MKKLGLYLIGIILLLVLILPISAQEIKPFEDVLADYGISESKVVGDYVLNESAEIPIYGFNYIYKEDWLGTFIGKFFSLFGVEIFTKNSKIPAVEMSDQDWEDFGSLFVISVEDASHAQESRYDIISHELTTQNTLPAYRLFTGIVELGQDEEPRNVSMIIPAIDMGMGSTEEGEYNAQLWRIWRGGASIQR